MSARPFLLFNSVVMSSNKGNGLRIVTVRGLHEPMYVGGCEKESEYEVGKVGSRIISTTPRDRRDAPLGMISMKPSAVLWISTMATQRQGDTLEV